MNKNDVLILCQFFYPEYVSSATLPLEMAEDFVKKGILVNILCGYPKEYIYGNDKAVPITEKYNGINIKRVKYLQLNRKHSFSRIINQLSFVVSVISKLSYIKMNKCIIVYSDPPMLPIITSLVNRIFKVKFIFVAYDIFPDIAIAMNATKKNSIMAKMMELINKSVYSNASKIVALGEEMKDYLLKYRVPNESKIEVIPNWYDKNKLRYGVITNDKLKTLKDNGKFIVLYSGNMGTCQDMDTIVNVVLQLRNNKDICFVFTGHGNKANNIKKIIEDNNLENTIFYNFLVGEDYSNMLQIADCHIVSLEKGIEGLCVPSKTYSYLAAGRPLLAIMSQNTDISKMLKKYGAGFSFEQGNVNGFSETILYLHNNREESIRIGENARKAFLNLYERQICTEKYIKLVSHVLNRNIS
jgi:Glycosyltransferase